jgi:hypothetical protein
MPTYSVQRSLATTAPAGFINGKDTMIVRADNPTDALAIAKTYYGQNNLPWVGATVTELADRSDMSGIEARATVQNAAGVAQTYSYVGVAGDLLLNLVVGLTAVMNADTATFPSGVTSSGLVITIAAGNSLGAKIITAGYFVSPPNDIQAAFGVVVPTLTQTGVAIPGAAAQVLPAPAVYPYSQYAPVVSAVTTAGSARTITFVAGVLAGYKWNIQISDATYPINTSLYFGDTETMDLIGARMVVLLKALANTVVNNCTYTAGTNTLLIPGATDAQGAKVITSSITFGGVAQAALQPTVTAPGASSIDRNIVLPADTVLPIPRLPVLELAVAAQGFVTG